MGCEKNVWTDWICSKKAHESFTYLTTKSALDAAQFAVQDKQSTNVSTAIIITREPLRRVSILYICRVLGHLSY